MREIVCTCDELVARAEPHDSTCPMVTGVPVEPEFLIEHRGEVVELTSPEPPMARLLRAKMEIGRSVQIHLIDGSSLPGRIIDVSDDGTIGTIDSGADEEWSFDVAAVIVVEIRKNKIAKD